MHVIVACMGATETRVCVIMPCMRVTVARLHGQGTAAIPWEVIDMYVRRNFGGVSFAGRVRQTFARALGITDAGAPEVGVDRLIRECVTDAVARYPLVVTEDLSALGVLLDRVLPPEHRARVRVVFGPAFCKDRSMAAMCRALRAIKAAIEVRPSITHPHLT